MYQVNAELGAAQRKLGILKTPMYAGSVIGYNEGSLSGVCCITHVERRKTAKFPNGNPFMPTIVNVELQNTGRLEGLMQTTPLTEVTSFIRANAGLVFKPTNSLDEVAHKGVVEYVLEHLRPAALEARAKKLGTAKAMNSWEITVGRQPLPGFMQELLKPMSWYLADNTTIYVPPEIVNPELYGVEALLGAEGVPAGRHPGKNETGHIVPPNDTGKRIYAED